MLFTLESRESREIAQEVLLRARRDSRMEGCWPKSEPIIMVEPLPGAHGLDMNWRLVIPYGCDGNLSAALQDAAAAVQAKWRLKLPFLGSSAFAG
jgi:hypothetical protein